MAATKRCSSCRRKRALSRFYRCTARRDGAQNYCKDCVREHRVRAGRVLWATPGDEPVSRARYAEALAEQVAKGNVLGG